jgi:phage tail protein X
VTILAIAQQDDMLDAICWRTLGTTAGASSSRRSISIRA